MIYDPDSAALPQTDDATGRLRPAPLLDETEEFYEFGPDPWIAHRVWMDADGDEVRLQLTPEGAA